MTSPTLSLCVPAYNAARTLPRLLASAAAQTVPFDEILVYDDCSTDDTAAVAEAHGARVIRGEMNVRQAVGKNRLAEATRCEWIHFHDADDELKSDFVERAHSWMVQGPTAPDVVLFSYEYRDNETGKLLGVMTFDDAALRDDPVEYAIRVQINPFHGLYRRASFLAAGGCDEDPEVLYNEDPAMHLQLARHGLRFAADPAVPVVNYRIETSFSQSNGRACAEAQYHVMRKASELSPVRYRPAIAQRLWEVAGVAGSFLDWETADAAVTLARKLAGLRPPEAAGSASFRTLATLAPRAALRLREQAVRRLRPHLRAGSDG